MKRNRIEQRVLIGCGIILVVTGLAKIGASFGNARLLQGLDPVFGLPYKPFMIGVGLVEILVGLTCLFRRVSATIGSTTLVWLVAMFGLYRIGLWRSNEDAPCECLGNLTELLGFSRGFEAAASNTVFGVLTLGAGMVLWCSVRPRTPGTLWNPSIGHHAPENRKSGGQ